MIYEVIEYVLYALALIGVIIYELVYFFNIGRLYKCIVSIAKSKKFIAGVKYFYNNMIICVLVGVVVCIFCICYLVYTNFSV